MASDDEDHTATIYTDEQDLEDDADDLIADEEQTHQIDDEENEDVDLIDDDEDADADADEDDEEEEEEEEEAEEDDTISISSPGAGDVTVAGIPIICDTQTAGTPTTSTVTTLQQKTINITDSVTTEITKKPLVDDSRRLFQRLWTDEDEIELLQGFYEYITQRGFINSNHHHDTTAFYDQIKGKLQLDFNKNQLVEKLRRLKKKYRNILSKISAGKEYVFKSPHDQATFDLSCKIWNESVSVCAVPVTAVADGGFDDEEMVNVDGNANAGFNLNENVNGTEIGDSGSLDKKGSRSRKRSRSTPATVKVEENYDQKQQQYGQGVGVGAGVSNVVTPNVVEETVKSCLLPLFKELVNSSMNGARGLGLGIGGMNVGAFGGGSMGFQIGDMSDEKWRKQHILELEVYSKRLELMQDQIKSKLEELKSMGS